MKKIKSLIIVFIFTLCLFLVSCGDDKSTPNDLVSQVKLEQEFEGKTFAEDGIEEVELYRAVDGDTIHVTNSKNEIYKLRFLGVDTPESTSSVEPWGIAASAFTKSKVKNSVSIVITSDGGPGEHDSYGRWLSWVWYKSSDDADYRLLNLELVQEGYSISKNSGVKNYYDELVEAADKARESGIRVWGEEDDDYHYDNPISTTLVDLKKDLISKDTNSDFFLKKVVFDATVSRKDGETYYLTQKDSSTGKEYSIQVFHRNTTGKLDTVGNKVRISGFVTYYEVETDENSEGTFQLTGVKDLMISSDEYNLKLLGTEDVVSKEISPSNLDFEDKSLEYNLVTIENIDVVSTYTTQTVGSSSRGAITITGKVNNQTVTIRTTVLVDKTGTYEVDSSKIVLASNFANKNITVTGIIEAYSGNYQIKLVSMNDVTFN